MDHTRYQQWKHSWLTCGRVLLTLSALTVITLVLYLASQNTNLLHTDDNQSHHASAVRNRRDKLSLQSDDTAANSEDVSIQPSTADGNKKSQHKKSSNEALDRSITTSVTNDNKTLLSDKSKHFDGITYHSDGRRRSVEGGNNKKPMTYAGHNKYKMKRKRKKITSNSSGSRSSSSNNNSDIMLPKNSIRDYKNVTDVNALENFSPDMVMDENKIAATNNVRHKKDQLIIREDQGVVIVRKYTCVPCQRVPGQRTSIKTRPKYRGMFLRHACC